MKGYWQGDHLKYASQLLWESRLLFTDKYLVFLTRKTYGRMSFSQKWPFVWNPLAHISWSPLKVQLIWAFLGGVGGFLSPQLYIAWLLTSTLWNENISYHINNQEMSQPLSISGLQTWIKLKVAQLCLCPTLCNSMGCRLPGSSIHGILQARILEWVAILFSRGSSQPKDWTQVSHIAGGFFTVWATREAHWCVLFDNCHCWALWRTVIQLLDLFTAKKNVFNLF